MIFQVIDSWLDFFVGQTVFCVIICYVKNEFQNSNLVFCFGFAFSGYKTSLSLSLDFFGAKNMFKNT